MSSHLALVRFFFTEVFPSRWSSRRGFPRLLALVVGLSAARAATPVPTPVDYAAEIKPILLTRCYACHGGLQQKAGLRLDTGVLARRGGKSGAAVVPGDVAKSLLFARVTATNASERMPQEGDPLKPEQIELLRRWIAQGAVSPAGEKGEPDPREHWAFQPPVRPAVPALAALPANSGAETRAAIRNPLDAYIAAEHRQHGLTALPEAGKGVVLRRVYLDLIGLPPTREELQAFLADARTDAYERVVERLLDDPRHGERWARHWMDLWRYADWFGRRMVPDVWNSAPQIWRWRDWIVRSLNTDRGYDRMLREMLAADEVAPGDDDAVVATGYLVRNWYALNPNQWMRDNVKHTGKAFLGLTFNCAHCHDHKYDPITQRDYFGFRAFFEPIYPRQDRVPGEADPGKYQDYDYSTLRKIVRTGLVRVFDQKADAPTWFYTGGDERNRVTNRPPVQPSMPGFLGGDSVRLQEIALPLAAYYPGMRAVNQATELAQRREAITTAETELAVAKKAATEIPAALREAVKKAETALEEATEKAAESGQPAALEGKQSLVLDATTGRRVLNHPLAGLPALPEGTAIRWQMKLLLDGNANVQLAKDTQAGLTAAYVAFTKGRILAYQPGTTKEAEVGKYDQTAKQDTFNVALVLEPKADCALLTVTSLSDQAVLVKGVPTAINGWNPVTNKNQGLMLDVHAGTVVAFDELVVTLPGAATPAVRIDFEPPKYADGKDVAGVDGWEVSKFCAAPATSVVSATACAPGLRELQQTVTQARQAVAARALPVAAAEAKLAAARTELASATARIAAEGAKYGAGGVARATLTTNQIDTLVRAASRAEREAAVRANEAKLAAGNLALAQAEGLPMTDKTRAAAIKTAGKTVTDSGTALAAAKAALGDEKKATTYTPLSPVYPPKSTGRRRALAEWIGAKENPLTARVAVNHIWAWHFHEPLVRTVNDFGRFGARPTHPELLDWLAVEFMESGWSMKHLHRLVVTSAAYRRASEIPNSELRIPNSGDSENRLLWRMNTGRMEAEVVRDSILHLAGELDAKLGGQELENKEMATTTRRSLYYAVFPELGGAGEFTGLFDAPDPNECYRRSRSIIPQQALGLTNSKLVHDQSVNLARRVGAPNSDAARLDNPAFITAAFEHILSRPPSRAELAECAGYLQQQTAALAKDGVSRARESLVRALLNQNDFLTVR